MSSPLLWVGTTAKLLKSILDINGNAQILSGAVDPSSSATSAPKGSQYLSTSTGFTYIKTDAGSSTNWVIQTGAIITPWIAYTPTFGGITLTGSADAWYRQVGTNYEILMYGTVNVASASTLTISLPNSATIASFMSAVKVVGVASQQGASAGTPLNVLATPGQTSLNIGSAVSGGAAKLTPATGSAIFVNASPFSLFASVPISGLSGTTSAAFQPVAARYTGSATSISGTLATVAWATSDYDTDAAMSAGLFTVPTGKGGKYQLNTSVQVTGTIALNSTIQANIDVNGTTKATYQGYAGGIMTALTAQLSDTFALSAGDVVRVQLSSSATTPAITNSVKTFISIIKVSS